jgi:hypothetical protein
LEPRIEKVTGGRLIRHKELNFFSFSTNMIVIIKSKSIRWAGHVECYSWGDIKFIQSFVGKPEEIRRLVDIVVIGG